MRILLWILGILAALFVAFLVYDYLTSDSEGLGDSVAKLALLFGFEKTPGCGCAARQEKLNKTVSY